jgi:cytochrome P450
MEAAVMPARAEIPNEVARKVVLPSGYKRDEIFYAAFRWLRANVPLGIAQVEGYDPLWLVTKHADIMAIERDANLFHSGDENPILSDQASDKLMRSLYGGSIRTIAAPTFMDPPEHAKYRAVMAGFFSPARIAKMGEMIRVEARKSVEAMLDLDGECDFMADVALHFPLHVLMPVLGVPPEDKPQMLRLTQDFFGVHDPDEQREELKLSAQAAGEQWLATIQDFTNYFTELREDRRREPRDDFLSAVAHAKIDGEYVGDRETIGFYISLITAGHDTTSSTSAGGMLGMMRYPEQFTKVKEQPALIPGLVDEAVRWTCVVKHFMRSATRDTELRGQQIKAGERLMLCYPSGNRDEEVFDNADAFNVERKPNRHLGFGFGPHMCIGQHLAKLELKIFFEELLPRLKSIDLAGEPKNVETNYVGGLKHLPMRFKKA